MFTLASVFLEEDLLQELLVTPKILINVLSLPESIPTQLRIWPPSLLTIMNDIMKQSGSYFKMENPRKCQNTDGAQTL